MRAWQRYDGYTLPDGRITVAASTNDDEDLGYPNTSSAWSFTLRATPGRTARQAFDHHCGKCRVGVSGVVVTVTLDGEEVR